MTHPAPLFRTPYIFRPGVRSPFTCRHINKRKCGCHDPQPEPPPATPPQPPPRTTPAAKPAHAVPFSPAATASADVEIPWTDFGLAIRRVLQPFPEAWDAIKRLLDDWHAGIDPSSRWAPA